MRAVGHLRFIRQPATGDARAALLQGLSMLLDATPATEAVPVALRPYHRALRLVFLRRMQTL